MRLSQYKWIAYWKLIKKHIFNIIYNIDIATELKKHKIQLKVLKNIAMKSITYLLKHFMLIIYNLKQNKRMFWNTYNKCTKLK